MKQSQFNLLSGNIFVAGSLVATSLDAKMILAGLAALWIASAVGMSIRGM